MRRNIRKIGNQGYKTWMPLLLAVCTAFGMLVGYRMSEESSSVIDIDYEGLTSKESNNNRLNEILKYIDARYVDTVDRKLLLDSATEAIFRQLDPHSVYIPPEELIGINEGMSGFYRGLGIETILFEDTLRIINILDESPAAKSQLKYGDKILAINDSTIAGINMPRHDQWELLRVSKEKEVKLTIEHIDGYQEIKSIQAGKVKSPNVDYFTYEDVSYIGIKKFSDNTYEEIIDALENAQKEMIIKKLIIDLRDNPGGYLPEATKILNQLFVEDKRLLVYTQDKTHRKSEYNTTGRPFYKVQNLAILINENSASASEIIAGALQDWDKAIIIGQKSFGKGLVQEQYNLSNGGAIRLTTARYYTPTGRFIQTPYNVDTSEINKLYHSKKLNRELIARGGIIPDRTISWTDSELDIISTITSDKHGIAYKFIEENATWNSGDSIVLHENWEQALHAVVLNICEEQELICDAYFPLAENILKETIFQHIDKDAMADSVFVEYDIMIQAAIESLNAENIFTELKATNKN